ncbi:hypothetical protein AAVH_08221 [Aphelenchoides avenae]|nr:hypothetical protein AAVH_08221 [Aphelenchus avenae]
MEELHGNAVARANPTPIPNETLLIILRWLHRFDLDGVQITTRRLRSLVENNDMPLRCLDTVTYIGDVGPDGTKNVLILEPKGQQKEQCPLDVVGGISMARRYLTSAFIRVLVVSDHDAALPNRQLLTAYEEHISCLSFERCNFKIGAGNALEKTVCGCRFRELSVKGVKIEGWQLNNHVLRKIARAGGALVDFDGNLPGGEKYAATDEGILDYCFSSDLGALKDRGRSLSLEVASITPALVQKCIQASAKSKVTGRVELTISNVEDEYVRGGPLAQFRDNLFQVSPRWLVYGFTDEGNGTRLQIDFTRESPRAHWRLDMRHGNKDDKDFFSSAHYVP